MKIQFRHSNLNLNIMESSQLSPLFDRVDEAKQILQSNVIKFVNYYLSQSLN
jgi:hypothetical protein